MKIFIGWGVDPPDPPEPPEPDPTLPDSDELLSAKVGAEET